MNFRNNFSYCRKKPARRKHDIRARATRGRALPATHTSEAGGPGVVRLGEAAAARGAVRLNEFLHGALEVEVIALLLKYVVRFLVMSAQEASTHCIVGLLVDNFHALSAWGSTLYTPHKVRL